MRTAASALAELRTHAPTWFEIVEQAAEYVVLIDESDQIAYVNVDGFEPAVGAPVYRFVEATHHDVLRAGIARARETGLPQRFETRAVARHGGSAVYSNWVHALPESRPGRMVAVIAADVTAPGRVAAQLELSEQTLRSLVDNSPDSILIIDRDRRVEFVSRLERGVDPDDVLGARLESFLPEHERRRVTDTVERAFSTGTNQSFDTSFDQAGGRCQTTTRVVPIPGSDGVERVMLAATDVTARIEAERERERLTAELVQAQKMEALGQLTGGVAHDFNNILIAIGGNLELAELSDDVAERSARIGAALEAVRHANALTQRLLAFSRKQALRPRPVDVGPLLRSMREILTSSLGERVDITVDCDDLSRLCRVDPGQLESAVLNLALNARDAMPAGGSLRLRARDFDGRDCDGAPPPGDYILLEVEDDGTGIPPEVEAQVFEPFFTTKDVGLGTGLGLSTVYGFVLQSGGHIELVTEPGRGTTVQLYLPSTDDAAATDDRPVGEMRRGHGELILVVEDNELVRSLTAALLDRLGYRTVVAASAGGALDIVAAEPDVALVVTDAALPGPIDGVALAARARAARPDLPILFVSGYPHDPLAERGALDGSDRPLMKPYTARQLAEAVARRIAP